MAVTRVCYRLLPTALLLWLAFSSQVWGSYELRVRLHQYENPDHRIASGRCCDNLFFCLNNCDNLFRFCLRPEGANIHVLSCPFGSQYAGHVSGGDRITFRDRIGRLSNPITFRRTEQWTGSFQLHIEIHDKDLFYDDFVDSIFIEPHTDLLPDQPYTEPLQYTGTHRRGRVSASFQVVCQEGYYRADCSVFCQETEQSYCDENGDTVCRENHYPPGCVRCEETAFSDCDSQGNIVCRDTYFNPPVCDTLCIPMDDDVLGHYTCNFDGGRVCMENYYGENCSVFCEEVAEQYTCNGEGERVCEKGFHGTECDAFCEEKDDEFGHFNCSEAGEKLCLFGYQDPTTNCTQQICEPACELVGGFCNGTSALCECFEGWGGQRCSECATADGCSNEGGYCIIPGQCLCRNGYNGSLCETVVDPCVLTPCKNNATCTTVNQTSHQCHCTAGFTGNSCEDTLTIVNPLALQDSDGLSAASIVGIVIGVLCFFAVFVLAVALFTVWRKRRNDRVLYKMYRLAENEGMPNPMYQPQVVGDHIMSSESTNGSLLNDFQNPLYVAQNQPGPPTSSSQQVEEELSHSYNSDSMYSTIDHRPQRRSRGLRQPLLESFSSASTVGVNEEEIEGQEEIRHHPQRSGRARVDVPEEEALYIDAEYSLLSAPEET